jgi:hypothetical protein
LLLFSYDIASLLKPDIRAARCDVDDDGQVSMLERQARIRFPTVQFHRAAAVVILQAHESASFASTIRLVSVDRFTVGLEQDFCVDRALLQIGAAGDRGAIDPSGVGIAVNQNRHGQGEDDGKNRGSCDGRGGRAWGLAVLV